MENQSHSFIAGLFVIGLLLAAIAGAIWLGPHKGPKPMPVDLITRHGVVGLKPDAPVRFRGVDIGHVESIAFDPTQRGQIRVRIAVDPAAPLTRSTYAKLSYQGLTGVAFVLLDDTVAAGSVPLTLSNARVAQMDLQASFLELAEDDAHDVVQKAGRIADRLDELLSEQNQKRLMALVDTFEHTLDRYRVLAQDLEPAGKSLPSLLEQAKGTVGSVTRLADDADRKLSVLDDFATAARHAGSATEDLHRYTLPRLNATLDAVSLDARELNRTLHQVNARPQSFIFGPQSPLPGPGEQGFVQASETSK